MNHDITHRFVTSVKREVKPGTSVLILLAASEPERRQRIEERLQGFGAKILELDLPLEIQTAIETEIEGYKAA